VPSTPWTLRFALTSVTPSATHPVAPDPLARNPLILSEAPVSAYPTVNTKAVTGVERTEHASNCALSKIGRRNSFDKLGYGRSPYRLPRQAQPRIVRGM